MTVQPTRPRVRLLAALGLTVSAMLSPSGKIISSAVAATALIGGLITQLPLPTRPASQASTPTSVAPTRTAQSGSSAPVITFIELDEQTLPVVLTENPTGGNRSSGRGLASASFSLGLFGGGGNKPGMGSPRFGARHGAPARPQFGAGASGFMFPQSSGNPMAGNPPPSIGRMPPASDNAPLDEPRTTVTPSSAPVTVAMTDGGLPNDPSKMGGPTSPQGEPQDEPVAPPRGKVPGLPEEAAHPGPIGAGPNDVTGRNDSGDEMGAPMPPQGGSQDEPLEFPLGDLPGLFKAPESHSPPGTDDPINPVFLTFAPPESLLTEPSGSESPSLMTRTSLATVPEPATMGLILLGLLGLAWSGRRAPSPARRA